MSKPAPERAAFVALDWRTHRRDAGGL